MKKILNGKVVEMTTEEEAEMREATAAYWRSVSYDEAVNAAIRTRYTESQEFAILRQRDTKPEEYAVYNDYCEKCKLEVKAKIVEAGGEV